MKRKPEWIPTINEIRDELRAGWEDGTECPCCSQKVKLYKRRVNKGMAEVLVELARETVRRRSAPDHRPYVNVERKLIYGNEELQGARDWQTLRFWGLIEALDDGAASGRKSTGEWRITEAGLWVVAHPDRALLHDYVLVYNNRRRGVSDEKRSLKDALQRPFSWEEVAGRAA